MRAAGSAARIEQAFAAALETPAPERLRLLTTLLSDPGERAEVQRLLRRHETLEGRGEPFLDGLDASLAGALLEAANPDPEAIGRYRVQRRLGTGGSGVVYLADDPELGRAVAIKVLRPEQAGSPAAQQRLRDEARAVSALDHPHIATIHEIDRTSDGDLYVVMGYYAGRTLRERIAEGPLPVAQARRIAAEIADALAATHERGLVHRDVKPENVLLTDRGVRLVDFGIAAAREGGAAIPRGGTAAYMSPEQARGEPPDPRSDVWALGVVLYEMLTGRRPFDRGAGEPRGAVRGEVPVSPRRLRGEVPEALAVVALRCLRQAPDERPPTAGAVERMLRAEGGRRRAVVGGAVALVGAGALAGVLLSGGATVPATAGPDLVAESLYVRGMALLERRTLDGTEEAAIAFRSAIERDSTHAGAYAGLARALAQGRTERPGDLFARTRPLLERAVALDPDLPGVLLELGWIRMWYDRDWAGAEPLLRRALARAPTDPWAYHHYAAWLSAIGRIDQAVELERRASAVDPRGAATTTHVALHLNLQRKHDEAIRLLEGVLRVDSTWARTHVVLGRAYLSVGRYEEALRHLRRGNYQFAGFDPAAMLAYGLGVAGQHDEARRIAAELESRGRDGYVNPFNLVACYLGLGDIERALDWAERIVDDPGLLWFPRSDPMFDPLFAEPRFQRVLERVGLDSASVARLPDTRAAIDSILGPRVASGG